MLQSSDDVRKCFPVVSMSRYCLCAVLCCWMYVVPVWAAWDEPAGPWQQVVEQDGIRIDVRPMQGTNVMAFRGQMLVHARLQSLVALVQDTDNIPTWMHRIKRVTITQTIDDHDFNVYMQLHSPWPFRDRDAWLHTTFRQNSKTGVVTVHSDSVEGGEGLAQGCVRMPKMTTEWVFTPLPNGVVRVLFTGFGLPGGVVPDWAVNLVVTDLPFGSLRNMQRQILRVRYQQARFPGIDERISDHSPNSR